MMPLSIHTLRESCAVTTVLYFCSMVLRVQATPLFSPDVFHKADDGNSNDSKCPRNADTRAAMCIMKLSPIKDGTPGGWNHVSALQNSCRNGDFLDGVNCIERVMLNCRHDNSDEAFMLKSNIDVQKTRKSVLYFCDNIETYTSNFECMKSSHPEIDACGREAIKTFKSQNNATSNKDTMVRFQCPLYNKLVLCQKSIFTKNCGQELSKLVFKVMVGFEPPICKETAYTLDGSDTTGYSFGQTSSDSDPNSSNSIMTHGVFTVSRFSLLVCLLLCVVLS